MYQYYRYRDWLPAEINNVPHSIQLVRTWQCQSDRDMLICAVTGLGAQGEPQEPFEDQQNAELV